MEALENAKVIKPISLLTGFAGLSLLYFVGVLIHRLYFHPLHKIPGPWINAISRVPFARHLYNGTTAENALRLHEKYGEVVRLSPNEVSFTSGETAWQEIYGFRTGKQKGQLTMQKDTRWYSKPPSGTHIIIANDADHTRYRRTLAHAFSEKALANQEPLLQKYTDLLVSQFRNAIATGAAQDMAEWYNYITFDIIADLTLGTPFGCLENVRLHKFVHGIFYSLSSWRFLYLGNYWPLFARARDLLTDAQASIEKRKQFFGWIKQCTADRMAAEVERPDFMTEILKHNGEKGAELTEEEISNNNAVFLTAGSETTATLLAGVTYALMQNPRAMQLLKDEVRGRWKQYDDITLAEVHKAPYLVAVLQEGLRYFPPVPTGFERRVPQGGAVVSGYHLPEGTGLSISQYPLGRSEAYFKDANSFIPERWMGDERFANDKRDCVQAFNLGPRNCLGKNLAIAEMRLILAKMIWSFDLQIDPRAANWMKECKVQTVWNKPPLWTYAKEAVRAE